MSMFRKRPDPISERARALKAEITALESQISRLNDKLADQPAKPRLRSTAVPGGQTASPAPAPSPSPAKPMFESVDTSRLKPPPEAATTQAHYNDLGVRKLDLAGGWDRLKNHFRPPPAANPQLVNFLAVGSIQGLRPLRYEKRVARNRFILFFFFLLLALAGLFSALFDHR
jgi:hypothetical protein